VGGLPENEDERGHQAIFSGHVGMSEQSLKLFYLFVSGFLWVVSRRWGVISNFGSR
jgi:hypothetical protein